MTESINVQLINDQGTALNPYINPATAVKLGTVKPDNSTIKIDSSGTISGNIGTVTKVNNTSPDANGNVTITTGDVLPTQSGNSGKFLTTNGSSTSWATVSSGPTYTAGTNISISSNNVISATDTTYKAGTGTSIGTGNAINHSNSVTAATAGTSSATSGSTLAVPYVTYDAQGHITASGTHTHTVSGFATSDTQNTCGAGNSTSKLYLVGRTAQSTGTSNSNSAVYTQSGYLYSTTPASTQNDTTVATTKFVKDQGYTSNLGTITGITMNGSSKGTSGVVDLGTVITSHQSLAGCVPTTRTVNGKALSSNISLTASDVGALSASYNSSTQTLTLG